MSYAEPKAPRWHAAGGHAVAHDPNTVCRCAFAYPLASSYTVCWVSPRHVGGRSTKSGDARRPCRIATDCLARCGSYPARTRSALALRRHTGVHTYSVPLPCAPAHTHAPASTGCERRSLFPPCVLHGFWACPAGVPAAAALPPRTRAGARSRLLVGATCPRAICRRTQQKAAVLFELCCERSGGRP